MALYIWRTNPEIFVARSKMQKGTKGWDRVLFYLLQALILAIFPVAGLDHSSAAPVWVVALGYVMETVGMAGTAWVMRVCYTVGSQASKPFNRKDKSMNRIVLPLLLGVSLASVFCFAADPLAPPPFPPPLESPTSIAPTPITDLLPKARDNDAALLKAAQDERIKVLGQLVEILLSQYTVGTVDFNQLGSAQNELSNALLDSMEEPEKRIAMLEKQLVMANDVLSVAKAKLNAGTVTQADAVRAKAVFLDVKIKLLRERNRKLPPTPNRTGKQP